MRKLLSKEIADAISALILEKYPPGAKIPIEAELADMFSVSRTTVREAIKLLSSQGVLEVRRGYGTFVKDDTGLVCDPFGMKFMERETLIKEMGEFSLICQPGCSSYAAQRATLEDLTALEENFNSFVEEWCDFKEDRKQYLHLRKLDIEFHALIRKACHNQIISRVDSIFLEFCSIDPVFIHALEASIKWHPLIIDAIRRGDYAASENAMRQHILSINEHIETEEFINPLPGKNMSLEL